MAKITQVTVRYARKFTTGPYQNGEVDLGVIVDVEEGEQDDVENIIRMNLFMLKSIVVQQIQEHADGL